MSKPRKKKKHPWYSKKGYLHFDYALTLAEATRYVKDPANIAKHKFSPFIHYIKVGRKIQRDLAAEKLWKQNGKPQNAKPKLRVKSKPRNIFYASHIDGYIYSYYTAQLLESYTKALEVRGLQQSVLAYRSVSRNGKRCSNIQFARDAFAFLQTIGKANVSCFDLSKFFDRLDAGVLKANWAAILGSQTLPADHETLYRQLTNFTYVEEDDLIAEFNDNFADNPRLHKLDPASGGSRRNRICDYKQLRALHEDLKSKGGRLIHPKGQLDITGIAQGSSIAGLLSNIFMLEFDVAMKAVMDKLGGLYLRYSDDIFLAYPELSHQEMRIIVGDVLRTCCGTSVAINDTKTENAIVQTHDGKLVVLKEDGKTPARIQYLGFHLSSNGVHIRNSSLSKDRGKTVQAIAQAHRRKDHGKIDTRSIYKTKSHRQATTWNPKEEKGFMNYALRVADAFEKPQSLDAQIKKTDKFIRRAVKRRRERIARENANSSN
ncbi:MAG: hypothetical protein DI551_10845 [Micavibrio aeruginosavorus]|uniref:Reverse transcriptase domain-containing protein n=1 Tax=Micavibrio aeruginosavorus TaxID=349221 RepID=A0A2W5MS80_9BACT|nr:MAG: hypothetical protein DI551_10845 [Micavibrio aeruginosavorus]